ncbi:uncharacterized protein LAJ45_01176 [Morchella importuna]|uniref:uncharacterized protein n=1 Tax=Morchella importuna TaxID=1174673 RepID=UPI001E8E51DF|nr:uncharacterized protein LAJ45_01176 [Morchella importuna]KAH8154648.1 hypothetical protein LAJ45_01176 [Morchella importuna]
MNYWAFNIIREFDGAFLGWQKSEGEGDYQTEIISNRADLIMWQHHQKAMKSKGLTKLNLLLRRLMETRLRAQLKLSGLYRSASIIWIWF